MNPQVSIRLSCYSDDSDHLLGSGPRLIGFHLHSLSWKMNQNPPLNKYPYLYHTRWRRTELSAEPVTTSTSLWPNAFERESTSKKLPNCQKILDHHRLHYRLEVMFTCIWSARGRWTAPTSKPCSQPTSSSTALIDHHVSEAFFFGQTLLIQQNRVSPPCNLVWLQPFR